MYQFVITLHVLAAVVLVGLVLLQQGKGATMGASFGAGASQTVFGSQGSSSILVKITSGIAFLFFATSIMLGYIATQESKQLISVNVPVATEKAQPESNQSSVPKIKENE